MKTVARSVLAGLPQGRLAGPERNFTGAEMQRLHLKCGICRPVRLQGGTRRTMSRAAARSGGCLALPFATLSRPGWQVPRQQLVTIETHRLPRSPRTPATHG
jgi:hypothetical protein